MLLQALTASNGRKRGYSDQTVLGMKCQGALRSKDITVALYPNDFTLLEVDGDGFNCPFLPGVGPPSP